MADEKGSGSKKPGGGSSGDGERIPVLVELKVDKGQSPSQALFAVQMDAGMNVTGFQLDTTYGPIPVDPSPEQATEFAAGHKEVVIVRGLVDESKIEEIKRQANVVNVYRDAPIEPFPGDVAEEEDFAQAATEVDMATCPIPPCDCQPSVPKGTIADVANYLRVDEIWAKGIKGQGIVVGVVDGGISAVGRVAGGKIPRVIGGWPTGNWGKIANWGGHGNMSATDVLGMAPQANLYDIRIAAGSAQATVSAALQGYQWAINQHKANGTPHILTNSWGMWQKAWAPDYATNPNHPFTRKVVEALNEGIIVLYAAGNCGATCGGSKCAADKGPGKDIWGANGHPRVMTIGAANIRGQFVGYSSQGPAALDPNKPDFCGITHFTGYFHSDSGTSAATPIVAGVVALLKQCKPTLTQEVAKATLKSTAKNIGPAGWDQHSGSGIIQAKAAYDKLCGPGQINKCLVYRVKATKYLTAYKKTKNKKYLCQYYRYLALYFRCRYQETKDRKNLCQYYRYMAYHYRCLYGVTRNKKYLCQQYRYLAAYHHCLYQVTRKRRYLCNHYRYMALYYRCLYGTTKNRQYLCQYHRYLARYYQCLYLETKNRRYRCLSYREIAAYYLCLYRITKNRTHYLQYQAYWNRYRRCQA